MFNLWSVISGCDAYDAGAGSAAAGWGYDLLNLYSRSQADPLIRERTAFRPTPRKMCNMCTRDETIEAPPPPPKVSRMLEKMKKKHNIVTDPANDEKQKEVEYQPDLLAVSTQFTKIAYDMFKRGLVQLQESKAYV